VLCLGGDIDSAVVEHFKDQNGREPVAVDAIDAGAVTFISSVGLAIMLRCVDASLAAGRPPVLRASSHPVDRLLQLMGMESSFARP
jgi:anti-anti-sigma regulatory factor